MIIASEFGEYRSKADPHSAEAVFDEYELAVNEREGIEILYACYTYEGYEGSSTVVFKKDDQLFLVEGGHCSCNGLEGQWVPTATTVEALKLMPAKGYYRELPRWEEFLETL